MPIRPEEVVEKKKNIIPAEVFEAIDELIVKHYSEGKSKFTFDEAASSISAKLNINKSTVYSNKYLDIEEVYREVGWEVLVDNAGYNESYESYWVFKKRC